MKTKRRLYAGFALISSIVILFCGCAQQEKLSFDKAKEVLSGSAADEALTAEYSCPQYCMDPVSFERASLGLPFQIPLYDPASEKFREPADDFWYCPIIHDRQVLAMLTLKSDDGGVSVSLDAFMASALSETLAETDSPELAVFWCSGSLFALDAHGQVHLLNANPEQDVPTFPDGLRGQTYPSTDFSAALTPVSAHLRNAQ